MNGLSASRGLIKESSDTGSHLQLKLMERQNTNTNDNDGSIEDDDSLEDDSDDIIQQGIDRDVVTYFSRYISIEGKPPMQPMDILQDRFNT